MQSEQKSPMLSQPDNKPMSYGGGVMPANAKRSDPNGVPSPAGKSSAPWQAGHGSGKATNGSMAASRTAPSAGGANSAGHDTSNGAAEKHESGNLG